MDGGELREGLRDLLRTVRVVRRQQPEHSQVPAGMAGVLAAISETAETAETGAITGPPVAGCHVKDLAVRCALDASTVSRAVAALVRLGFVRRDVDPADGRAAVLTLTAAGHEALRDTHDRYDRLLTDALGGWSRHELDLFAGLLRRLNHDVVRHVEQNVEQNVERNTEAAR